MNIARTIIIALLLCVASLLPTVVHAGVDPIGESDSPAAEEEIRVDQPVTKQTLDRLNPLKNNADKATADALSTPGGIVSRFLTIFAFPIAGLILFVMLLWGGFEMMSGAADKKSIDAGKQRVTAALLGFLLLFVSYWMARILEMVFGITIL